MVQLTTKDLLKARVHLGHVSKKWNPYMAPYIFMQANKKHVIDLNKTLEQLTLASNALRAIARSGKKILFVATKKQAKDLLKQTAESLNMPYMAERWLGGTLTNYITIRKLTKKITSIEKMMQSTSYLNMAKKERLTISRDKVALERILGGMLDLTKLPGALVVVDITKEHIAVKEANKLGITVIGLVDTNANPNLVDYPIPSNDDATTSISIILNTLEEAIAEGLAKREEDKVQNTVESDTGIDVKHETPHQKDIKHESFHHRSEKRSATHHKVERRETFQQRALKRELSYHKVEFKNNVEGGKADVQSNTKTTIAKKLTTNLRATPAAEAKIKASHVLATKAQEPKTVDAIVADTKAVVSKTVDAKASAAKAAVTKAADVKTSEAKAAGTKAVDTRSSAVKAKATQAVNTETGGAKAEEHKVAVPKAKATESGVKEAATAKARSTKPIAAKVKEKQATTEGQAATVQATKAATALQDSEAKE